MAIMLSARSHHHLGHQLSPAWEQFRDQAPQTTSLVGSQGKFRPDFADGDSTSITLRGSTDIIVEFFQHAITCILYQRGIYPPEDFERASKYGLVLQVAKEAGLVTYINNVLGQLKDWLTSSNVQKLVVVVNGLETAEVLERWVFDVETSKEAKTNPQGYSARKSHKEISNEIAAIIRQITCSVAFLPLLRERASFDLLVYTDKEVYVPSTWEDSDPRYIQNAEEVRLRSLSTKVHKIDTMVAYRMAADDEMAS